MRSSDWSSDVCSSDLPPSLPTRSYNTGGSSGDVSRRVESLRQMGTHRRAGSVSARHAGSLLPAMEGRGAGPCLARWCGAALQPDGYPQGARSEERRVGKECVSVDLGGRRILKKKKRRKKIVDIAITSQTTKTTK